MASLLDMFLPPQDQQAQTQPQQSKLGLGLMNFGDQLNWLLNPHHKGQAPSITGNLIQSQGNQQLQAQRIAAEKAAAAKAQQDRLALFKSQKDYEYELAARKRKEMMDALFGGSSAPVAKPPYSPPAPGAVKTGASPVSAAPVAPGTATTGDPAAAPKRFSPAAEHLRTSVIPYATDADVGRIKGAIAIGGDADEVIKTINAEKAARLAEIRKNFRVDASDFVESIKIAESVKTDAEAVLASAKVDEKGRLVIENPSTEMAAALRQFFKIQEPKGRVTDAEIKTAGAGASLPDAVAGYIAKFINGDPLPVNQYIDMVNWIQKYGAEASSELSRRTESIAKQAAEEGFTDPNLFTSSLFRKENPLTFTAKPFKEVDPVAWTKRTEAWRKLYGAGTKASEVATELGSDVIKDGKLVFEGGKGVFGK